MHLPAPLRGARLGEYAIVAVTFLTSRSALHLAGIRLFFDLRWMFLADPEDLRHDLVSTLYYFHAYPPGTNAVTGLFLKVGGAHAAWFAHASLELLGLVLVSSLLYLLRSLGFSFRVAAGIAIAFSLLPQSIYFEHLYLYAYPIAALLCLAAALLHRALDRPSRFVWLGFFSVCAAMSLVRSTYHLVWFVGMVGFGVWVAPRSERRRVLVSAAAPAAALLALYAKNLLVFGVFGAMTAGPANMATVTVMRLPQATRDAWVAEGKLSPFAAISVYEGPRAYLPYFGSSENERWPASMNALERPSIGIANYNHWFFLEVDRKRRADTAYYLKERTGDYLATALHNLKWFLAPSTEWHPHDTEPTSPHYQHRQILGGYERAYNGLIHGFPFSPIGLYILVPFVCAWSFIRAWDLARIQTPQANAERSLFYFCLVQIAFVTATSCLFTFGETSRYRYDVEPLLFLLVAAACRRVAFRAR